MNSESPFLIETSALEPALGNSTPRHVAHFQQEAAGKRLTSVYVRKEFLRRWFCDMIILATAVDQVGSVADALSLVAQEFGRGPKSALSALSRYLRERGSLENSTAAADEIASLAYRTLLLFDRSFDERVANACGCQIGDRTPEPDRQRLLDCLQAFYDDFVEPIVDCPVNAFLDLHNPRSRARSLTAHPKASKLDSVAKLASYVDSKRVVSCPECGPIGDVVIALEQPADCSLIHIDSAFDVLCPVLERDHRRLKSLVAVEKSAREET